MRLAVAATLVVVVMMAALVHAQLPDSQSAVPQPQCALSGTVVDSVTGTPLAGATVSARFISAGGQRSGPGFASGSSDAEGKFHLENLSPGRYLLSASRSGYVTQFRGSGFRTQATCLSPGQTVSDLVVRISPGATISGPVVSSQNKPISNVRVEAVRHNYRSGRSSFDSVQQTVTNQDGQYQFTALAPGKYFLHAIPAQKAKDTTSKSRYVPTYFPAAPGRGGSTGLVLRAGDQMAGIAITLTPVRTVTISGHAAAPSAKAASGETDLSLVEENGVAAWPYEPTVDDKGNFQWTGVPVGNYVLMAHRAAVTVKEKPMWGQKAVQVADTDLRDVEIPMSSGGDISGRISLGDRVEFDLSQLTGVLEPVQEPIGAGFQLDQGNADVTADGAFAYHDVPPGNYRLYFYRPRGQSLYLKSAQAPGVLETGITVTSGLVLKNIDLVLSSGAARVDGAVQQDQQPSSNVQVVLVPEGERRAQPSYFRTTTSDNQGRFALDSIPPGDYKLFAWQAVERNAYMDPEFLRQFEDRGKSISLKEGSSESVQLDVIPAE